MALSKSTLIDQRVQVELGSLAYSLEQKEREPVINLVSVQYYTAVPIMKLYRTPVSDGTVSISVPSVMSSFFGTDESNYFFVGVTRADYLFEGEELTANLGYASLLSGVNGVNIDPSFNSAFGYDASSFQRILTQTNLDFYFSDLHLEFDELNQVVRVTAPVSGNVTLGFGFGYNGAVGDPDQGPLRGVPNNHLDVFAKMVALEICKEFITSRSLVDMENSDFKLQMESVEQRITRLQEEVDEQLSAISPGYMLFG